MVQDEEREGGSALPDGTSIASHVDELRKWGAEAFAGKYPHPFLLLAEEPDKRGVVLTLDTTVIGLSKSERNAFESQVTVGRAKNNDIIISSPEISKVHAVFTQTNDGTWRITDIGSANGTLVNTLRVGAKPVEIKSGDKISFSNEKQATDDPIKSGDRISNRRYMFEFMDTEKFLKVLRALV